MIGESPRHEKLTMGRVWIGPNGMIGPPWWRTEPRKRPAGVIETGKAVTSEQAEDLASRWRASGIQVEALPPDYTLRPAVPIEPPDPESETT